MGPDMFGNFNVRKNHKDADNSTTTEAREKMSAVLESLEFNTKNDACLTKFNKNQILVNKISHVYLATTKPFTE